MSSSRRRCLLCAILAWLAPVFAWAGESAHGDANLRAALVYNFALYTEWPGNREEAMVLCLAGRPPQGGPFEALGSRLLRGRPILLRRLEANAPIGGCHVLYLDPALPAAQRQHLLRSAAGRPVLTIAHAESDDEAPPLIALVSDGGHLGFDIQLGAARAGGLTLSSRMLRLARTVR